MKKYLRKILNILFIRNEAIEYIEKDTKKNAKKTYKILKNICILITALIFAYTLIYVRLEGIVNAFENSKDLEFSISKDGIDFGSDEDKGAIKEYVLSNDLDIITINDKDLEKDNEEQHKKIYENWNISKTLDIKEELNRRKFIRYGNL